jgi:transposase InsO family protein
MCSSGGQRCKLKLHTMWLDVTLVSVSRPYTWRLLVHYNLYLSQHGNGKILYGRHYGITQDCKRVWLYLGYCWPAYENFSFKTDHPVTAYAQLYIARILSLHGVPKTIVSDRGSQFVSKFWEEFHKSLGTKLLHSSAYRLQTSGQTERVNQILEDMLRASVLEFPQKWDECLPLAEFSYNNSYQESIKMAPFKALYGRRCRTPLKLVWTWRKVL